MNTAENIAESLKFIHPDLGDLDYGIVELMVTGCSGTDKSLWSGSCSGKGCIVNGWFSDRRKLVQLVQDIEDTWVDMTQYPEAFYISMNPVKDALLVRSSNCLKAGIGRTQDKEIAMYRNIFLDINADCPTGVSSSYDEHIAAIGLAKVIRSWIRDNMFWPEPMLAESGNGAHLVYKCHFDNTPENVGLVKTFIKLAKEFFDRKGSHAYYINGAVINATVFNPSRMINLHGTGPIKEDWDQHRRNRVLEAPKNAKQVGVVTPGMLEQAIDLLQRTLRVGVFAKVGRAPNRPTLEDKSSKADTDGLTIEKVPRSAPKQKCLLDGYEDKLPLSPPKQKCILDGYEDKLPRATPKQKCILDGYEDNKT
jgi:hypothetical protein